MELQATIVCSRLASFVKEQPSLHINRCIYWKDSRNVPCWIRSPKPFIVFVANHIEEIPETTRVKDWRYVLTKVNPHT